MDTEGVHAESVSTGQVQTNLKGEAFALGVGLGCRRLQGEGLGLWVGLVLCVWEVFGSSADLLVTRVRVCELQWG